MDPTLIERARLGDVDPSERIARERMDSVYRLSLAIAGEPADAADAAQETFLAAWRQLGRLRETDRFDAWLTRIAVNAARMTIRGRRRRRVREIPADELVRAAGEIGNPTDRQIGPTSSFSPRRSVACRSISEPSSRCTTSRIARWQRSPRRSASRWGRSSRASSLPAGAWSGAPGGGRPMNGRDDWTEERLRTTYRTLPTTTHQGVSST